MWDPCAEFKSTTLSNGLDVHVAHWSERPWEAMGFIVHTGAASDPEGLEGLEHLVEHLVSKNGSATKEEMDAFFDRCGGMTNFGWH